MLKVQHPLPYKFLGVPLETLVHRMATEALAAFTLLETLQIKNVGVDLLERGKGKKRERQGGRGRSQQYRFLRLLWEREGDLQDNKLS
jgi:hypothetical protein